MFKQKTEEQKKLEETKQEEEAKAEIAAEEKKKEPEVNPDDVDLKAPFEYTADQLEKIESARLAFNKFVKKENIFKWLSALLAIAVLIVDFIVVFPKEGLQWLGFVLAGVAILIIVAYYLIVKQFNNKKMGNYLKEYYGYMNAFVFGDNKFSGVNGDIDGKISKEEFSDSLLFKDIAKFGSRNIVEFLVNGNIKCKICDCAAQKSTTKKLEPIYIGKHIIAENDYTGDDPIMIYLTGNNRALPPNNVDSLPKVLNTKKMIIYTFNKNYESFLNSKARTLISNIITNNILVDCSISITKGKTFIDLGYDDCLMVLPLREKFNPVPMTRFKTDMVIVADLICELNRHSHRSNKEENVVVTPDNEVIVAESVNETANKSTEESSKETAISTENK